MPLLKIQAFSIIVLLQVANDIDNYFLMKVKQHVHIDASVSNQKNQLHLSIKKKFRTG